MNLNRLSALSNFLIVFLAIASATPCSVDAAFDETKQGIASGDPATDTSHSRERSTDLGNSKNSNELITTATTANELAIPTRSDRGDSSQHPNSINGKSQLMDVGVKLGIVVGLFLIAMILMSKKTDSSAIPKEAIEVLGRVPFSGKQALQLVRFGQKLVLVESSANGLKPISEMTDPVEVQNMLNTINSKRR